MAHSPLRSVVRAVLPRRILDSYRQHHNPLYRNWEQRAYAPPSPQPVKERVLLRHSTPDASWVETGTYLGNTTAALATVARKVYTIEPEPTLYRNAAQRFAGDARVEVINGLSEEVFPRLIPTLSGNVCFWLDGHYSAGVTHQGPQDTPINDELACIERHLGGFDKVAVLIDDIRLFNPTFTKQKGYPPLDSLVDWARQCGLNWQIEHDIFIARNFY